MNELEKELVKKLNELSEENERISKLLDLSLKLLNRYNKTLNSQSIEASKANDEYNQFLRNKLWGEI